MATIRKGTYKFNSTLTQITNQHNLNSALFSFRIDNPDTEVTECTAIIFNFNSETELGDVSYEYSNDSVIAYSKTDGWYPEYQTIIVDETQNVTINPAEAEDDFWTWFNANAVEVVPEKLSYDLSTSSKWANLSEGSHHVTIVAKADTYRDSKPSIGVDIVKTASAGETWVLNENATFDDGTYFVCENVPFTSNQTKFTSISMKLGESGYDDGLYYGNEYVFYGEIREWVNSVFRTITFDNPVTDTTYVDPDTGFTLLEWLQAYGNKQ